MKVYYNGVTLSRVLTKKWDETVRYDDTGVNALGSTIVMTFEASICDCKSDSTSQESGSSSEWVNTAPDMIITGSHGIDSGTSASGSLKSGMRLKHILRLLQIPQGLLRVYDDVTGQPIFEAYPNLPSYSGYYEKLDGNKKACVDVKNGPKPLKVSVDQCLGGYYRISFEIEVNKIRCWGGETLEASVETSDKEIDKGVVISHRCWTEESVDDNFYTTRVTYGKITASSTNAATTIHNFRPSYYPSLEDGFKRVSVKFSESNDGLSMNYVVTDRQIRNSVPFPATSFTGTIQYTLLNAAVETANISLTIVGSPFAPRNVLLDIASATIYNKIAEITKDQTFYATIVKFDVIENMGDPPSFTINCSIMITCKERPYTTNYESSSSSSGSSSGEKLDSPKVIIPDDVMESSVQRVNAVDLACKKFLAKEIAKSFPAEVKDYYTKWTYDRKKSYKPNAFGYNIYNVYDDKNKEVEDDPSNVGFSFIKEVATVPCSARNLNLSGYTGETASSQNENTLAKRFTLSKNKENYGYEADDLSTYVERQEYTPIKNYEESGVTNRSFNFPYTLYKSHAVYTAKYNRSVKPKYFASYDSNSFDEPVIVDVAPPEGRVFVTIEAERLNCLPELPDPEEILTVKPIGETEGGIQVQDSGDSSSDDVEGSYVTTSNSTINNYVSGKRTSKEIIFTCLTNNVQIAEPKSTVTGEGVYYTVRASYEYALSRPIRKGDEIRLLLNPIMSQESCYYPRACVSSNGAVQNIPTHNNYAVLYNGNTLNHLPSQES